GDLPSVILGAGTYSLREFTRLVLDERIRFCAGIRVRREEVRCRIRRGQCPRCSATVHFAEATPPSPVSLCGLSLLEVTEFFTIRALYRDWRRELESLYSENLPLTISKRKAAPNLLLQSPPGKPFKTAAG